MQTTQPDPAQLQLLEAALPNVAFDGWSQASFQAAVATTGMDPDRARALCPRGATDLAVLYHREGDRAMQRAMTAEDMTGLRYSDKVARAIRLRLDVIDDKEAVRRGTTLFALPHLAATGAGLIWGTADAIWTALGDTSDDVNWYTKRATLSGVWAAVVLYWLGDTSENHAATDDFIDRRIAEVMQIEKVKAQVNGNAVLRPLTAPLNRLLGMIRAPQRTPRTDVPGMWRPDDAA
ncbi:ubiquinone biosynthesis protein COQ9 [Loktanella fryxellensis]|uniref:Ubiquinone biosynthesis protein COQ9 n=1 Tax=Loktanella fryxellensis TaxID=245187 RepID=A0A1H8II32_9RHOB|nr:COQ9 family protein [Loktanella fryxellensis]SEN67922.1 ubiquinone biosynthesis protein COQ9 [Loktanella fryxellensis]